MRAIVTYIIIASLFTIVNYSTYAQNQPVISELMPAGSVLNHNPVTNIYIDEAVDNPNRIISYTPLKAMTNEALVDTNALYSEVSKRVSFLDGFNQEMYSQTLDYAPGKSLISPNFLFFSNVPHGYLPYTVGNSLTFVKDAQQQSLNYYAAKFPIGSAYPVAFSKTTNTSTATERSSMSYMPGKSQVGQNRGVKTLIKTNAANTVRIWDLSASSVPVSSGFYAANQLIATVSTDQDGNVTTVYHDKSGKLILKELPSDVTGQTYKTQHVYDAMGKLRFIITPKAMQLVPASGSYTFSTVIAQQLCFEYQYDDKARLSAQRRPDEKGFTEIVYDRKDRIVMRRSPLEQQQGKWEVLFYDYHNRIIATSLYTHSGDVSQWQKQLDTSTASTTSSLLYYLTHAQGEGKYPGTISNNEILSYNYYDHYTHAGVGIYTAAPFSSALFAAQPAEAVPSTRTLHVPGMLTASRIKLIKPAGETGGIADWVNTVYYYDENDRVIQIRTQNATKNATNVQGLESISMHYDFTGRMVSGNHIHENKKTAATVTEFTKYDYHAYNRKLEAVHHKVNAGTSKRILLHEYDEVGNVLNTHYGEGAETQQYSYDLLNRLTAINENYVLTGNKDGKGITYGEILRYDYGFTNKYYNGKLSGKIWRGSGGASSFPHSYGFNYDKSGRLESADYYRRATNTSALWKNDLTNYSVANLRYDANGNILSMQQWATITAIVGGTINSVPTAIDKLRYTYAANSNQLTAVMDTTTTNYQMGDFQDGNLTGADYDYDVSGNLTKDLNKGITAISYTHFNKPQVVSFSNGNKIQYIYDAGGNKVKEIIKEGTTTKNTEYIGNKLYRNDTLQQLQTAAGRTVYDATTAKFTEQYFIKDYLGNIRTVIEDAPKGIGNRAYVTTYELENAVTETALFDQVGEIRTGNPQSTFENHQSGLLNKGTSGNTTGTSLLLKVMAGDGMELSAQTLYESVPVADEHPAAEDILRALAGSFSSNGVTLPGTEGSGSALLQGALLSEDNIQHLEALLSVDYDTSRPAAFITYMYFDEGLNLLPEHSNRIQASSDGSWTAIGTEEVKTAPQNGYLLVYQENQSSEDVYFDNLSIIITPGVLKEETHYYPHGLPIHKLGSAAVNFEKNRHRYQGNEYLTEAGLNWMDFNFRQYDPQLGRFLSIDPLADDMSQSHFSPYAAMGNRPQQVVDPNGLKGYNFSAPFIQYMPLFTDEYSMRRQLKANAERDAFLYGTPLPRVVGEVHNPFSNIYSLYGGGNPFASSIGGAGGGSSGGAGGGGTGGSNPPNLYFKIDGRFFIAYYDKDNNFNFSETPFSEDFVFVGQRTQKQQSSQESGFLSDTWNKTEGILENIASSVTLTVTGFVMPIINQGSVIWNEGIHSGSAWHQESKVSWAVPYKVKSWKFVRQDQMMGQTLSWENGKEVMKSTTNTLFLITPIKHNIPIPGAIPWLQNTINWGAAVGTKEGIKQGVYYWLDN